MGHAVVLTRADASQNGYAQGRPFGGVDGINIMAEHIRLDLPPQFAASAAAGGAHLADRGAQLPDDIQAVQQAVGDALHHRADHIAAPMGRRKPEKRRLAVGVQVGRALAHHVGQIDQPVACLLYTSRCV